MAVAQFLGATPHAQHLWSPVSEQVIKSYALNQFVLMASKSVLPLFFPILLHCLYDFLGHLQGHADDLRLSDLERLVKLYALNQLELTASKSVQLLLR